MPLNVDKISTGSLSVNGTEITPGGGDIQTTNILIPSINILNLNLTPYELIPAPGVGKVILPISVVCYLSFAGLEYQTNTFLYFSYSSTPFENFIALGQVLGSTESTIYSGFNTGNKMLENESVVLAVPDGNPTNGNSDLNITIKYSVIDITQN
jgi:hypothetical protein